MSLEAADVPTLTNNQKSRSKFLDEVITILKSNGEKWKKLLEEEEYQLVDGTKKQVPKVLIMCSGPIANQKIGIENYMLIDYNVENCLV